MKELRWARRSQAHLDAFVDYLLEIDPRLADRALTDIAAAAELVALRPDHGRPSRWEGFREKSIVKWRKIIVYDVSDSHVTIMALFDARQDLSKVMPEGDA